MFHMARQQDRLHMQHFFDLKWMDGWMTGTARYFLLAKMQMSSAVSSVVSKDFFQLVPDAKQSSTWGKATLCVGQLHVMFCIPNRTLCKCVTLAEQTVLAACVHATSHKNISLLFHNHFISRGIPISIEIHCVFLRTQLHRGAATQCWGGMQQGF